MEVSMKAHLSQMMDKEKASSAEHPDEELEPWMSPYITVGEHNRNKGKGYGGDMDKMTDEEGETDEEMLEDETCEKADGAFSKVAELHRDMRAVSLNLKMVS